MRGIDRLRTLAGKWDAWGLGGPLVEIADEIERERFEDCQRMGLDYGAVSRVITDMERHVLGHEGMEDSPVARWARELRDALKSDTSDAAEQQKPSWHDHTDAAGVTSDAQKVTRDPAEDVSMSAYDLLPADERDAIAWVRERGGLDYVKAEWRSRSNLKRMYEKEKAKVERQQRHIEFVQGKCRERQGHIVDLNKKVEEMRPRLMPEGMEWLIEAWPKFDDDAPVKLGDMALIDGDVDMVEAVQIWIHGKPVIYGDNGSQQLEKGERVKRSVVDSWERLEEDVAKNYVDYWGCGGFLCSKCPAVVDGERPYERFGCCYYPEISKNCTVAKARDIVRRCRALAERERGE